MSGPFTFSNTVPPGSHVQQRVSVIQSANSQKCVGKQANDALVAETRIISPGGEVIVDRFAEAESVKQLERLCNRLTGSFNGEPILNAAHTAVLQADITGKELKGRFKPPDYCRPGSQQLFKHWSPSPSFTTSSPSSSVQSVGSMERNGSRDNLTPDTRPSRSSSPKRNLYIKNLLETPSKPIFSSYISDIFPPNTYHPDFHVSPSTSNSAATGYFPEDEKELLIALSNWDWSLFDQYRIPCVTRNGKKFVSVQMMQLRILIKYTKPLPVEQAKRLTMPSYRMTLLEAWILNTVNALYCEYDCGFTIFQEGDELVEAVDAEIFYWAVKVFNLRDTLNSYKQEIRVDSSVHFGLADHISSLKRACEAELRNAETMQKRMKIPSRVGRKRKYLEPEVASLPKSHSNSFAIGQQHRDEPQQYAVVSPAAKNHIQILKVQGNYNLGLLLQ